MQDNASSTMPPSEQTNTPPIDRPTEYATHTPPVDRPVDHTHTSPTQSKPSKTFPLRFVLSLIFGPIFIGCLVALITIIVSSLFDAESVRYYDSSTYASLSAIIVVSGTLHLALALSVRQQLRSEHRTYQTVLSIIYCSILALIGLIAAWQLIVIPFNFLFGVQDIDGSEILQIAISCCTSLVIILVAIFEQSHIFTKIPKLFYTVFMGVFAIATIILTLIFPAMAARNAAYDRVLESNLNTVEYAIDSYVDDNNQLPDNLSDIEYNADDIDISQINYSTTDDDSYQLCATFKTNSMSKFEYDNSSIRSYQSFYRHEAGYVCFDRDADIIKPKKPIIDDISIPVHDLKLDELEEDQ